VWRDSDLHSSARSSVGSVVGLCRFDARHNQAGGGGGGGGLESRIIQVRAWFA
jgi:hypothetical protein